MISRLQYITQDLPAKSHALQAEEACVAGCDWIQLRTKNRSFAEWKDIGLEVLHVCRKHGAKLIINDNITIAREIGADGVHLGKNDTGTAQARRVLGTGMIIGGTANTFEDIAMHVMAGVDYIGLGPYRFTTTKEELSPILGIEGYRTILERCHEANIHIPIVAIGGIVVDDLKNIMKTGMYGVAVSSAITNAADKKNIVGAYMSEINKHLIKGNNETTGNRR